MLGFNLLIINKCLLAYEKSSLKIINKSDEMIYKEIFRLQSKKIENRNSSVWKKIEKLKLKLNNKLLIGTINADKYLHPTGWRSSYSELKNWLNEYHSYPDAYRIYSLAIRKKPSKAKSPKKPTGNFLNGYGNISKDLIKPTFPLSKNTKYKRYSFKTSIK